MGSHLTREVPEGQPADKWSYVSEKSPCTLAEPTGGVDQRFDGGFGSLPSDKKVQILGVMTLSRRGLPQESPVFDWQHSDEKPRGMDIVKKIGRTLRRMYPTMGWSGDWKRDSCGPNGSCFERKVIVKLDK